VAKISNCGFEHSQPKGWLGFAMIWFSTFFLSHENVLGYKWNQDESLWQSTDLEVNVCHAKCALFFLSFSFMIFYNWHFVAKHITASFVRKVQLWL
jgi:hypothetical protein